MVTLYFTKQFHRGLLKGLRITESMPFVSYECAQAWLKGIAANQRCLDYAIEDRSFQDYRR